LILVILLEPITSFRFDGSQEDQLTFENMRSLRKTIQVAKKMGKSLGPGEGLQRKVSEVPRRKGKAIILLRQALAELAGERLN
jgi:hypothetical protein